MLELSCTSMSYVPAGSDVTAIPFASVRWIVYPGPKVPVSFGFAAPPECGSANPVSAPRHPTTSKVTAALTSVRTTLKGRNRFSLRGRNVRPRP
jgi:hypothetical protein